MTLIHCNWCGEKHAQPSQSALQALTGCLKEKASSGYQNCGQDECLPARQFNREVELHAAREAAIAKYHRDFNAALDRYMAVLFGGDR